MARQSNSDTGNVGLHEFAAQFNPYQTLVVGDDGMKAEDFLSIDPVGLFK